MAFVTYFSVGFEQTDLEVYKLLTYAVLVSSTDDLSAVYAARKSQR